MNDPIRITVGELGQAATNITQRVEVLNDEAEKWPWLSSHLDGMLSKGQVLVFTRSIQGAAELSQKLGDSGKQSLVLHGDLDQGERMRVLDTFRKRSAEILIATDVAARGLDVPTIHTVVSYDAARDIETHTHRVGRTGRAGADGEAFTLLIGDGAQKKMAGLLVEHLEQAGCPVSRDLISLASKHPGFIAARMSGRRFEGKRGPTDAKRGAAGGGRGGVSSDSCAGLGTACAMHTDEDVNVGMEDSASRSRSPRRVAATEPAEGAAT